MHTIGKSREAWKAAAGVRSGRPVRPDIELVVDDEPTHIDAVKREGAEEDVTITIPAAAPARRAAHGAGLARVMTPPSPRFAREYTIRWYGLAPPLASAATSERAIIVAAPAVSTFASSVVADAREQVAVVAPRRSRHAGWTAALVGIVLGGALGAAFMTYAAPGFGALGDVHAARSTASASGGDPSVRE